MSVAELSIDDLVGYFRAAETPRSDWLVGTEHEKIGVYSTGGTAAGAETIDLTWPAAADEVGGERDVLRYVIWRRPFGAAVWGDPYRSIPAGNATYLFNDQQVAVGETWEYQLAAQDCTPALSLGAIDQELVVAGP